MDLKFGEYRYSLEQALLYKGNELIALKRNQAGLLGLFLSNPDRIYSKEDILDLVWQNKVVSEQVVFQTISQLRSIFGNEAITTFAKQGYKWQVEINSMEVLHHQSSSIELNEPSLSRRPHALLTWLIVLVCTIGFYFYANDAPNYSSPASINLHLASNSFLTSDSIALFNGIATNAMTSNQKLIMLTKKDSTVETSQLFAAPTSSWNKAKLAHTDWLIFGNTYQDSQTTYLHYGLVRGSTTWQGYVEGKTKSDLAHNFKQKLLELKGWGLFNTELTSLGFTEITAMQQSAPNNLELKLLLANEYIQMGQFDAALAYLKQVISLDDIPNNMPLQAEAYWLIGKIYKIRKQHYMANVALDNMLSLIQGSPLWPLIYKNIKTSALLAFEESNYLRMTDVLTQGVKLAEQQADPYSQFEFHILFAMLAGEAAKFELKHTQLELAQSLLLKHKLDDSNLVAVYYYLAEFSPNSLAALPYLEKVLALPRTANNYWLQDDALQQLISHYLTNNEFIAAHQQLPEPVSGIRKLKLKADIWLAQNKPELAVPLLIQSFDQARIEHNSLIGANAARTLIEIDEAYLQNKQEYIAFLEYYSTLSEPKLQDHKVSKSG